MRSEIEEVGEHTTRVGSPTMPHKVNPNVGVGADVEKRGRI